MYICSQYFKESDDSKTTGSKQLEHGAMISQFDSTDQTFVVQQSIYDKLRKSSSVRGITQLCSCSDLASYTYIHIKNTTK